MLPLLESYRALTPASLLLRLALAVVLGGLIGLNGTRKMRAAGFRTYMLVCMGAALTMILSQYSADMLHSQWAEAAKLADPVLKVDISRYSAKVMSGIGFLGAGSIILSGRREVKGVTTAVGLSAAACMGVAIGAGFYEGAAVGFLILALSIWILPVAESHIIDRSRNLNIFVELESVKTLTEMIVALKAKDIRIYDIEIGRKTTQPNSGTSAVIMLQMNSKTLHTRLISDLADIDGVYAVKEIL